MNATPPTTHKPGIPGVKPERPRRDPDWERQNDAGWDRPGKVPLPNVGEGDRPKTPKPGTN